MDVGARFPAPAKEGDVMRLVMTFETWSPRAVRIGYEGQVAGRVVIQGHEVRGLFVKREGRLSAGDMTQVKNILDV